MLCLSDISYGEGNPRSIFSKFVLNLDRFRNFQKTAIFLMFALQFMVFKGVSHMSLVNHLLWSYNV